MYPDKKRSIFTKYTHKEELGSLRFQSSVITSKEAWDKFKEECKDGYHMFAVIETRKYMLSKQGDEILKVFKKWYTMSNEEKAKTLQKTFLEKINLEKFKEFDKIREKNGWTWKKIFEEHLKEESRNKKLKQIISSRCKVEKFEFELQFGMELQCRV